MDYIYLISIGFKEETHTKNEFQNCNLIYQNVFQATSQLQGKETSTELKRTLRLTAR